MLREKEDLMSTRDADSGTTEYILPYDTPLKPRCRPRYAVRMNEYPVEDNQYGCNCYVYEYEDIHTHRMCKRLITNLPDEVFWEMVEFSQRYGVCHCRYPERCSGAGWIFCPEVHQGISGTEHDPDLYGFPRQGSFTDHDQNQRDPGKGICPEYRFGRGTARVPAADRR